MLPRLLLLTNDQPFLNNLTQMRSYVTDYKILITPF